ncbi:hypothetical protein BCL57_001187 [Agromyces flavus]|uniref:Uncharacterized protein n=1 Tax=Agromyces flavus TaxID=589382 RepID=A0A1H1ZE67_9MICO|nr:hypothetical protein [Agromyces flavus]MCP2367033.1 hypothetical protein [Agromyces flavus]GGI46534.1 hypothetical protein GCM10010932_15100 [Agromyces flavus]SDT31506.1 hypothetical protein SAMN04489721_3112 [Agromyces flavus]
MGRTSGTGERPDEAAAAMGTAQQAAFGDGIVGGANGRQRDAAGADEAGDAYDGREEDHSGLVDGGPVDETDAAGGSRAGAGEVVADRARAADADSPQEEAGLAPGESD